MRALPTCQLGLAKPAGLQVLPKASFCQRTVLGLLQAYQQQVRRLRYPGSQQPVPVHRLGRGTSGELFNSVCKLHWAAAHCSAELSSTTAGFCVCNRFRRLHVGDVEQRPAHLGDATRRRHSMLLWCCLGLQVFCCAPAVWRPGRSCAGTSVHLQSWECSAAGWGTVPCSRRLPVWAATAAAAAAQQQHPSAHLARRTVHWCQALSSRMRLVSVGVLQLLQLNTVARLSVVLLRCTPDYI